MSRDVNGPQITRLSEKSDSEIGYGPMIPRYGRDMPWSMEGHRFYT